MVCTDVDTDLTDGVAADGFFLSDTAYSTSIGDRRPSVSGRHAREGDASRGGDDLETIL
jgi:hypothetical protein